MSPSRRRIPDLAEAVPSSPAERITATPSVLFDIGVPAKVTAGGYRLLITN